MSATMVRSGGLRKYLGHRDWFGKGVNYPAQKRIVAPCGVDGLLRNVLVRGAHLVQVDFSRFAREMNPPALRISRSIDNVELDLPAGGDGHRRRGRTGIVPRTVAGRVGVAVFVRQGEGVGGDVINDIERAPAIVHRTGHYWLVMKWARVGRRCLDSRSPPITRSAVARAAAVHIGEKCIGFLTSRLWRPVPSGARPPYLPLNSCTSPHRQGEWGDLVVHRLGDSSLAP